MKDRPEDITAVQAGLLALKQAAHPLGPRLDPERAAVTGFSFGGWTALQVGADGGFDAVLAQAPGLRESLAGLERLNLPVLIMNAGKDAVVDPSSVRAIYEDLPSAMPHFIQSPEPLVT